MAGTSDRTFEFLKQVQYVDGIQCPDFAEFDQAAYIKEALHDGIRGRSIYEEGVCAALCVYVLADWLNGGSARKVAVDRLVMDCNPLNSTRPTLQEIADLADAFDDKKAIEASAVERFVSFVHKRTGKKNKNSNMFNSSLDAVQASREIGPSLIAIGGITQEGHAILCDAASFVVFDPNYGYFKTDGTQGYGKLLLKILKSYSNTAAFRLVWY